MIEPKFTFFEMEKEVFATNASALGEARLRRAPETLDAINVDAAAVDKDAVAMFDAEMFAVAEVDQPVVANPAVGVNDTGQGHAPTNNRPQSGLFCIGDDLGVHPAVALEDAKHDGLAPGAAPAFAANPAPAE